MPTVDNGQNETPSITSAHPPQPGRRACVATGVLSIGSGSVHVTLDLFHEQRQKLPCRLRPALGHWAGGVLDPQSGESPGRGRFRLPGAS